MVAIGAHHRSFGRSDIWLTPPDIITNLGPFDLDPCAAPDPRPWPTATRHYAADGMTQPWEGRVWLNPPYSRNAVGAWLGKMAHHRNGIALTFARTDTDAFQIHVMRRGSADALFFLWGRLRFYHPDGRRATGNAGGPSVLIAYGSENAERLRTYTARPGRFVSLA